MEEISVTQKFSDGSDFSTVLFRIFMNDVAKTIVTHMILKVVNIPKQERER